MAKAKNPEDERSPEERIQNYQKAIDKWGVRAKMAEDSVKAMLKDPEDFVKLEKLIGTYTINTSYVKENQEWMKKAKKEKQEKDK